MISLYEESDIFILPTKAECAGIVFSEASMYGMPSVTHDTGGIPNYVEDGKTGRRLALGAAPEDFASAIESIICENHYEAYSRDARIKYETDINWKHWTVVFDEAVKKVNC
jgi:glycosyltransferase involved in cell wall biosynthesis